jgi:hypothetical protein
MAIVSSHCLKWPITDFRNAVWLLLIAPFVTRITSRVIATRHAALYGWAASLNSRGGCNVRPCRLGRGLRDGKISKS